MPVHLSSTIPARFGPRRLPQRPLIDVSLTSAELHTLALASDDEAIAAECKGRYGLANTLAWRAAALREAAR